jgi:methyltransferase-like protein/2-polyprenyl-3-methyl-5-hydroxy-6-metoxy-1,4-benzoquinol methylase
MNTGKCVSTKTAQWDPHTALMSDPASIAYDIVRYPGAPYPQTHPSRLATLASLHGMTPAPPVRCRVLELGCGEGANLIPMAYHFPDSEFLGLDLSAQAIELGTNSVAELNLHNIKLRALDIADVTPEFGLFDYIISHGVYSWVSTAIRAKMLSTFRNNLAPQGIAYVSYNCQPGSYLRDLTRAIMLFHVRDTTGAERRLQQARLLLQILAETSSEKEPYGLVLRNQYERVRKTPDAVLYHDDLDSGAEAFFLHQVVEAASRNGLQYLADATSPILTGALVELQGEPEPVRKLLMQIPETEWVAREQYLDFVKGRMFRETLLCHQEVELERPLDLGRIKHFQFSSDIMPASADLDLHKMGLAEFKTRAGQKIRTDHQLARAAFLHLGMIWPQTIAVPDLAIAARARLGPICNGIGADWDQQIDTLTTILWQLFCAGAIELDAFPLSLMATNSDRPRASLLVRKQLEKGALLTNLRHGIVVLEDPVTRHLVQLLDGTRTIDQLVSDLAAAVPDSTESIGNAGVASAKTVISRQNVLNNLRMLARLSLLIA